MADSKEFVRQLVKACRFALEIIDVQNHTIRHIKNIPFPTNAEFPAPPTGFIRELIIAAEAWVKAERD